MSPTTYEHQQIVEDLVYPALDQHSIGAVVLFLATRPYGKTNRAVAQQTNRSPQYIGRLTAAIEDQLRQIMTEAGSAPVYPATFTDDTGVKWTRLSRRDQSLHQAHYAFTVDGETDYATEQQMREWGVSPNIS